MRDPACPREQLIVVPTEVGKTGSKSYVHDVARHSLLASQHNFRLPNGAWSGGGAFYVRKYDRTHGKSQKISWTKLGTPWTGTVRGCGPISAGAVVPTPPPYAEVAADLSGSWATGYARARPGNPVASLGQFIGELRELPSLPLMGNPGKKDLGRLAERFGKHDIPSLKGIPFRSYGKEMYAQLMEFLRRDRLSLVESLPGEYLNYSFAWAPFVRDLRSLYNLWVTIDHRLAELVRKNGHNLRRERVLEEDSNVTQSATTYPWPYANVYGSPPNWPTGTSRVVTTTRTYRRVWWSGNFRYYVPDIGSSQWTRQAKRALFGANPTPSVVYELLPWSWLIDWFSNVGDVVSNASSNAIDNQYLTLHYGFVMKHTLEHKEVRCQTYHSGKSESTPWGPTQWPPVHADFVSVEKTETKLRTGSGNPFGLGVKAGDLSPFQSSILAALGLSRAKVT